MKDVFRYIKVNPNENMYTMARKIQEHYDGDITYNTLNECRNDISFCINQDEYILGMIGIARIKYSSIPFNIKKRSKQNPNYLYEIKILKNFMARADDVEPYIDSGSDYTMLYGLINSALKFFDGSNVIITIPSNEYSMRLINALKNNKFSILKASPESTIMIRY